MPNNLAAECGRKDETMRTPISDETVEAAEQCLYDHLFLVLERKGMGSFSSSHEALGVIEDERSELVKAIQEKAGLQNVRHELLDIAAACVFAVACIDAETLDW